MQPITPVWICTKNEYGQFFYNIFSWCDVIILTGISCRIMIGNRRIGVNTTTRDFQYRLKNSLNRFEQGIFRTGSVILAGKSKQLVIHIHFSGFCDKMWETSSQFKHNWSENSVVAFTYDWISSPFPLVPFVWATGLSFSVILSYTRVSSDLYRYSSHLEITQNRIHSYSNDYFARKTKIYVEMHGKMIESYSKLNTCQLRNWI